MEHYDEVLEAVKELEEEMKDLNMVKIDNVDYSIEHYFAADWKFLATCTGILAANSNYPCVWCKYCAPNKKNFKNTTYRKGLCLINIREQQKKLYIVLIKKNRIQDKQKDPYFIIFQYCDM